MCMPWKPKDALFTKIHCMTLPSNEFPRVIIFTETTLWSLYVNRTCGVSLYSFIADFNVFNLLRKRLSFDEKTDMVKTV